MGILRDWGILIGVLPMPRPEHIEQAEKVMGDDIAYSYLDEFPLIDKGTRNFLDLSSLSGSNVSVNDRRIGNYEGILLYNAFENKYSLKNSKCTINLRVRDLEKVTEKRFLN